MRKYRVDISTLEPYQKPKFSDFLKEQLEVRKISIEQFANLIGCNLDYTERLLNDELAIPINLYSKPDTLCKGAV